MISVAYWRVFNQVIHMATVFNRKARERIRQTVRTVEELTKGRTIQRRDVPFDSKDSATKKFGWAKNDIIAGAINNQVDIAIEDQNGVMQLSGDTQDGVRFIHLHKDGDGNNQDISNGRMVGIELIDGEWHVTHAQCEETPAP